MKVISFLTIIFCLTGCSSTINVYIENTKVEVVNEAFLIWKVNWKTTRDIKKADVVIKQVCTDELDSPKNIGEFHSSTKRILLNKNFCKNATKKNTAKLLAHELGHYFCIKHSNVSNSLMNDKIQLSSRKITYYEINSFKQNRYKFLIYLYFNRLTKVFVELS